MTNRLTRALFKQTRKPFRLTRVLFRFQMLIRLVRIPVTMSKTSIHVAIKINWHNIGAIKFVLCIHTLCMNNVP